MCHSKDASGLEEKGKKKFTSDVEDLFRQKKKIRDPSVRMFHTYR